MGCSSSKSVTTATETEPTLLTNTSATTESSAKVVASDVEFRIKLGAVFPDFECDTTQGVFKFHEFLEREPAWTVLFSHPKDFTPVCTTELGACHDLVETLAAKGVKLIGLSCDPVAEHKEWSKDVLAAKGAEGAELAFPLIADEKREIAAQLGMLDPLEVSADGVPMPARALFVIGPNKTNRLTILYPATTGRNFAEVERVISSLFLTQDFSLATPANWEQGQRVIVAPSVATEDAKTKFSNFETKELPSGKQYLRYVDCPEATPPAAKIAAAPTVPAAGTVDFKIKLGAVFPDFQCETTKGTFKFHEFLDREGSWTVLFSHPKDFTPVCTTELGVCQDLVTQFEKKGVKLIGLSCDSLSEHKEWSKDVLAAKQAEGSELSFPLIADEKREIAEQLGMLDPLEVAADGLPLPARALFIIGPNKANRLTILYPATTGRNFAEVLRVMDSLLLTQDFSLATPVNWVPGQRVIVAPSVTTDVARGKFNNLEIKALPSGKEYLRYVDCPSEPPAAILVDRSDVVVETGATTLESEAAPIVIVAEAGEITTEASSGKAAGAGFFSCC